jgi:hypothetical protein
MGECLAAGAPAHAEGYAETAIRIFDRVGARNDLAKANGNASRIAAGRRRRRNCAPSARQASAIFQTLGTRDEPARVETALAARDRSSPIPLLEGTV